MRMRWSSATITWSFASTAKPVNPRKDALVPTPSLNELNPLPASVLTTPSGVTLRTRRLLPSPTSTLPLASTATLDGELKEASVPVPSANAPTPLPASVVTTPPGETLRIAEFNVSATSTFPPASTATPQGRSKVAPVPTPLVNPRTPLPACVVTTPPGVTLRILLDHSDT